MALDLEKFKKRLEALLLECSDGLSEPIDIQFLGHSRPFEPMVHHSKCDEIRDFKPLTQSLVKLTFSFHVSVISDQLSSEVKSET